MYKAIDGIQGELISESVSLWGNQGIDTDNHVTIWYGNERKV